LIADTRWLTEPQGKTSRSALLGALEDEKRVQKLMSKAGFIGRLRYGLQLQDIEDVFQAAVATYLEIGERYPEQDNHFGILIGIFHKKCLEFLDRRERRGRVTGRFVVRLKGDRPVVARGEDPSGTTADRVVRSEDALLIRAAIDTLSPSALELVLTFAEASSRLQLIGLLGLNKNTFDSRLRTARLKLKQHLEERGVVV
jgi:DNA-directed RNA polymerase specialized sigma24 family protein